MSRIAFCSSVALLAAASVVHASNSVHLAYHWHLHQPIYWPERNPSGNQTNRYQFAADSINLKLANTGNFYSGSAYKHPRNALVSGDGGEFDNIFDKADRVQAYQAGGLSSINTILFHPDGGASVSYSGSLQENIWSLGNAGSFGYGSGWNSGYTTARGSTATYRTSGGHPRADMVGMTYHHAFSPLLPKSVLRKEIQIFKEVWWKSWGGNPNKSDHSKGFWPIESAFSETIIPVLAEEGYEWSIIANSHLARTCSNYLDVAQKGNSGWNCDPPNRADQVGPAVPANQWWNGTIDGRGGAFPAPYAYQAHRTKYVNPATGVESFITVVPMCDLLSYQNGFGTMGTGDIDAHIAPFNDPARPSIVLMAHDGDNAWGGGNSYYQESVPNLFNAAVAQGYRPTTIQQFLADHPVPTNALVHVEDGAWVNAAGDWGHPQFINWLWPPTRASSDPGYNAADPRTWYDLETPGWTEDWRNWAVLVAGANYCETAEQIQISNGGTVQVWKIQEPVSRAGVNNNPNAAEQAWHYYLGGLDSGFMYYGTSLDDEVKQTLVVNRAVGFATNVIGDAALDQTPPTVFKPQRFPWNPGGKGWGPLTGYQPVGFEGRPPYSTDFHIWTHVFDVSGVTNVTLHVRVDNDGLNPLADNANDTYAGGPGVGSWAALAMTKRAVPTGNITGNGSIDFFLTPAAIADYYWAKVTGYTNVLLDYYVSATDSKGNVHNSDIQHVWVDSGEGSDTGDGGGTVVTLSPTNPVAGGNVIIRYNPAGRNLASANPVYVHLGYNNWQAGTVLSPDPVMTYNAASNGWEYAASIPANATQLDCVFNNGTGTWDNNGGSDWHFVVTAGVTTNYLPFSLDGVLDFAGYNVSSNGLGLYAALRGTKLYVATQSPGNSGPNDHYIFVSDALLSAATVSAPWSKAGTVAVTNTKPFMATESQNTYVVWNNAGSGSQIAKSSSTGGVFEGVIDLASAFGGIPTNIYIAAAAYGTADGGALVNQSPAGSGPDLDPAEFFVIATAALADVNADGLFDRLDPQMEFVVQAISISPNQAEILWNAMPGRAYQVQQSGSAAGPWTDIPGSLTNAGPLQMTLSYEDASIQGAPQRFYRVKLSP